MKSLLFRECLYQYFQIDENNEYNEEVIDEGVKIYGNTCKEKGEYIYNDNSKKFSFYRMIRIYFWAFFFIYII